MALASIRLTSEHALVAFGVALAAASGLFAVRSIATNTGQPELVAILPPAEQSLTWKRGIGDTRLLPRDLDPVTTGSLGSVPALADGDAAARAENGTAASGRGVAAPKVPGGYVLLGVVNGTAVLRGPNGLRQVRTGATLPGAGQVTVLRQADGGWMLKTSDGLVLDQAP